MRGGNCTAGSEYGHETQLEIRSLSLPLAGIMVWERILQGNNMVARGVRA